MVEDILHGVPASRKRASLLSDHLRLEGEVVGLWFEMQARLETHFTDLAAQHGLSAVQAKVLLQLQPDGAVTMRALAGQLRYDASNLTGVVDRRAKRVVLTAEGQRLRRAFWDRLTNRSGPLGSLGSRDLTSLRTLLRAAVRGRAP